MSVQATINRLSQGNLPHEERRLALRAYAHENGWHPSDEILDYRDTDTYASGHLLVEHGLDHTAAITFLRNDIPFSRLSFSQQNTLVGISYNNLVDWHLFPSSQGMCRVYNRAKPLHVEFTSIHEEADAYRADAFDRVVGRKKNPNLPPLDDALLSTVSRWRRILATELALADDTTSLAELFNALFFIRAIEDDRRNCQDPVQTSLLDAVNLNSQPIGTVLANQLTQTTNQEHVPSVIDFDQLRVFEHLERDTVVELVSDFYQNRYAPYPFDFSLMSKHALSRIYERYISILRPVKVQQRTLFGVSEGVTEIKRKDLGEVYTPQYIARFFTRFMQENMSPVRFRNIRAIDPACGSGMFLRTLLELQCDPTRTRDINETTDVAFRNISGVDIEPNAVKAAKLSLYLLHLVLTGKFPKEEINVTCDNAISWFQNETPKNFDGIIANPPYVRWENVPQEWHEAILEFLGEDVSGRPDIYLAFLKIAIESASENGMILFVLPHTFLLSGNAKHLRRRIANEFWVRHLVDLSAMNVFEEASCYPVLLIAERRTASTLEPAAFLTKCTAFVGRALQSALSERSESNAFYSVYGVEQEFFNKDNWQVLAPQDYELAQHVSHFPSLDSVFNVRQGINSGSDKVFIRESAEIPRNEKKLYLPLLKDREMERYCIPHRTQSYIFYPFDNDRLLSEEEIKEKAPETWHYLEENFESLSSRSSVRSGACPWWRPERPRRPSDILRPKVFGPHLMLYPRYSLDLRGNRGISRTIFITHPEDDINSLYFCLAVLNSSIGHWQISTQSHKYSRGYARIEAVTLRKFHLPSPAKVEHRLLSPIVERAKSLVENYNGEIDAQLDELVSEAFGIEHDQIPNKVGGEGF